MPLTCYCEGDADWYFVAAEDFAPLATKRRQRCRSCGALINIGADCLRFTRTREPRTDIEESIYGDGDTVPLADYYNCEVCGGLFMALSERGYCVAPNEDMRELAREHGQLEREAAHA